VAQLCGTTCARRSRSKRERASAHTCGGVLFRGGDEGGRVSGGGSRRAGLDGRCAAWLEDRRKLGFWLRRGHRRRSGGHRRVCTCSHTALRQRKTLSGASQLVSSQPIEASHWRGGGQTCGGEQRGCVRRGGLAPRRQVCRLPRSGRARGAARARRLQRCFARLCAPRRRRRYVSCAGQPGDPAQTPIRQRQMTLALQGARSPNDSTAARAGRVYDSATNMAERGGARIGLG
jgi:hypothetical protein